MTAAWFAMSKERSEAWQTTYESMVQSQILLKEPVGFVTSATMMAVSASYMPRPARLRPFDHVIMAVSFGLEKENASLTGEMTSWASPVWDAIAGMITTGQSWSSIGATGCSRATIAKIAKRAKAA